MKNGFIESEYVSPQVDAIELDIHEFMAGSDQIVVTNPWEGNSETDL